jgi:anti-sigma factor RsiW
MRCVDVREHLNALIDNEVSSLTKLRLHRHLKHCARCAAELAEVQCIGEQARQWSPVTAPTALRDRVLGALPHQYETVDNADRPRHSGVYPYLIRWRFAGGLACLLLLHWIISGQLDAQRAALMRPPAQDATFAAAPVEPSRAVASAFTWRSQMLALMLESGQPVTNVNPKDANHEPRRTPKRTSANTRNGQSC